MISRLHSPPDLLKDLDSGKEEKKWKQLDHFVLLEQIKIQDLEHMKLLIPPPKQHIASEVNGTNKMGKEKYQDQEHILSLLLSASQATTFYQNTKAAASGILAKWEAESKLAQVKFLVQAHTTLPEQIYHLMDAILPPKCKIA